MKDVSELQSFLASVPAHAKIKIAGTILSVPLGYHGRIRLAHALKLKTLDLIHLAYADNLRRWGQDLEVFVTCDREILNNSDSIRRHLGIEVREPSKGASGRGSLRIASLRSAAITYRYSIARHRWKTPMARHINTF